MESREPVDFWGQKPLCFLDWECLVKLRSRFALLIAAGLKELTCMQLTESRMSQLSVSKIDGMNLFPEGNLPEPVERFGTLARLWLQPGPWVPVW